MTDSKANDHFNANQRKFEDQLVQNLVDRFIEAFNSHDAAKLGSLMVEDGEWTDVIGYTMVGRKEIERQHAIPFTTVLKDAKLDVQSYRTKWINSQIASIDIIWESTGHRTPEGQPILTARNGLINFVVTKVMEKGEKFNDTVMRIVTAHNTDYTSTFTKSDRKMLTMNKTKPFNNDNNSI